MDGWVVATVYGVVKRVNKLVYVHALRARYKPEIGVIVIGRVIEVVAPKRWRLNINFSQDAVLMLSAVNSPDGIQRFQTAIDELNMRSIFKENDIVSAEVWFSALMEVCIYKQELRSIERCIHDLWAPELCVFVLVIEKTKAEIFRVSRSWAWGLLMLLLSLCPIPITHTSNPYP